MDFIIIYLGMMCTSVKLCSHIDLKTKQGQGSIFTVKLRLEVCEDKSDEEEKTAGIVDFTGKRLLLVDDIEINMEISMMNLEMMGFEVEEACDGTEAVDKVKASAPGYYNAVLMDIQMPRMNGYDATRLIRKLENKELADIPVIAMTANAFDEDIRAAKEAGMNDHVAKPIDFDKLKNKLSKALK